jgi:predicted restriction endonuclease
MVEPCFEEPRMPTDWEDLIEGLRVWKRGNEVAVHKPLLLLMILARALRGGENRFRFRDLVEPLERALRDFGSGGAAPHPEYPFWHLAHEGCWVVDNSEELQPAGRNISPTKRALLENDATGHVPDDFWDQLVKDPQLVEKLALSLLGQYWPDEQIRKKVKDFVGLRRPSREIRLSGRRLKPDAED